MVSLTPSPVYTEQDLLQGKQKKSSEWSYWVHFIWKYPRDGRFFFFEKCPPKKYKHKINSVKFAHHLHCRKQKKILIIAINNDYSMIFMNITLDSCRGLSLGLSPNRKKTSEARFAVKILSFVSSTSQLLSTVECDKCNKTEKMRHGIFGYAKLLKMAT